MSKEEDNRDIFEKALDYAPIIGPVIGGAIGMKLARKKLRAEARDAYLRKGESNAEAKADEKRIIKEEESRLGRRLTQKEKDRVIGVDNYLQVAGKAPKSAYLAAGAYGGTATGALAGSIIHDKYGKRRK